MSRELEQHPTPPALADRVVAFAMTHFGEKTRLWVEPCCGAGALLSRLPEPRIGVEINAALVVAPVRCGNCMALAPADLGDVPRDAVCVVTNPPFNGTASDPGGNRLATQNAWLPSFLAHMATLAATGVFILPAGATAKRWWRDTVAAQPDIVVALERLGRVRFEGTWRSGVDVVLVALRLPPAWVPSRIQPAQLATLEAQFAPDMEIVLGGSDAANAMVRVWSAPAKLGEFTLDVDSVRQRQARLAAGHRTRRQGSTHIFLRVHQPANAERRLAHMRACIVERYRGSTLTSVFLTLSEFAELCAAV